MERLDKRTVSKGWDLRDDDEVINEVFLRGTGREAELIVAALKTLAGTVAVRDATVETSNGYKYGGGKRKLGGGVPLQTEVDELLESISRPNFTKE